MLFGFNDKYQVIGSKESNCDMLKEEFLKIKEAYKNARTEERKSIIDFLLNKKDNDGNLVFLKEKDGTDTFVKTSGGSGRSNYSSGRTLSKQYDLVKNNIEKIVAQAIKVYHMRVGVGKLSDLNPYQALIKNQCCDFQLLELMKSNYEKRQ